MLITASYGSGAAKQLASSVETEACTNSVSFHFTAAKRESAKVSILDLDAVIANLESVIASLDEQIKDANKQILDVKSQKERKSMEVEARKKTFKFWSFNWKDQKCWWRTYDATL